MPTDRDNLQWVEVNDFSPGIWDPHGVVLDSRGADPTNGGSTGAPLGAAQIHHATRTPYAAMLDSSGNLYHGEYTSPVSTDENLTFGVSGLVVGDTCVTAVTEIGSAPVPATILDDDFFVCGWIVPATTSTILDIVKIENAAGFDILSINMHAAASSTLLTTQRFYNATDSDFGTSGTSAALDPDIKHFWAVKYVASTGAFTSYIDGVPHGTVDTTGAHTQTLIPASITIGAKTQDEVFITNGSPNDAAVLALYTAAATSYAAYTAAVLALTPINYYHLNESGFLSYRTSPGTYRCVSAPGRGLIPAPKAIDPVVPQSFGTNITGDPTPPPP